jgi:hypothetical protein
MTNESSLSRSMIPVSPKRVGAPLMLTRAEMRAWARITPADKRAAELIWERGAPKRFQSLLKSRPRTVQGAAP